MKIINACLTIASLLIISSAVLAQEVNLNKGDLLF